MTPNADVKNDFRSVILLLISPLVAQRTVDVFKHLFQNPTYCEIHLTNLLQIRVVFASVFSLQFFVCLCFYWQTTILNCYLNPNSNCFVAVICKNCRKALIYFSFLIFSLFFFYYLLLFSLGSNSPLGLYLKPCAPSRSVSVLNVYRQS